MNSGDVLAGAHEFESMQLGDAALGGDDASGQAIGGAKVGVASSHDPAQQGAVVFVVEEADDLLGNVAAGLPRRLAPAVGRADQDIRLIDTENTGPIEDRDAHSAHVQFLDEPVGVLRNRGEVHDQRRFCRHVSSSR